MSYQHSSVYIVKIVDVLKDGETNTWYVGPYGRTMAFLTADILESEGEDPATEISRECTIEPLFSDDECLRVADYGRATHGSLR